MELDTIAEEGNGQDSPVTESFYCSVPFEEIYNSAKRTNKDEISNIPEDNLEVTTKSKFQISDYGTQVFVSKKYSFSMTEKVYHFTFLQN